MQVTNVFERFYDAYQAGYRFIIGQGGTRSSKTYSLCQLLIGITMSQPKTLISVIRRTFPALRASVMKDLIDLLKAEEIYVESHHNKTEHIYKFINGSEIAFFSADNDLKLRGRKHSIVWINEANEINKDIFDELNQRTEKCLFLDFNPSDLYSYIYQLYQRDNHIMIHSTYVDNPFLPAELVREIEHYRISDENRWRVMGLGEVSYGKETVFTNIDYFTEWPTGIKYVYGADWGYNDPTVIMKVGYQDQDLRKHLYLEEILYESYLKPSEILVKYQELILDKNTEIYCDHRPEYVDMISEKGFNIRAAKKDIKEGLGFMNDCLIHIHSKSENTIKEFRNYKYKKNGEKILDIPVDFMNHSIDASRYGGISFKHPGVSDWRLLF